MRSIEFLAHAIVFLLIKGAGALEPYNEQKFKIRLITNSNKAADPNSPYNPVFLEGRNNDLVLLSVFSLLGTPRFQGSPPPGVPEFMATEVLASARSNEKQFSLARGLAGRFLPEDKRIRLDDKCSKKSGSNSCKPGYVRVRYNNKSGGDDCDIYGGKKSSSAKQSTNSISVTTESPKAKTITTSTSSTSTKAVESGKLTSTESTDEPSNDQNKN